MCEEVSGGTWTTSSILIICNLTFVSWYLHPDIHILISISWYFYPGISLLIFITWYLQPGIYILVFMVTKPVPAGHSSYQQQFIGHKLALYHLPERKF